VAGAPISGVSSGPLLPFFTMSSIIFLRAELFSRCCGPSLVRAEVLEYMIQCRPNHNAVNNPEVNAEDKYCNDHHRRRRLHFLAGWRRHLAHLASDIAVVCPETPRQALHLLKKTGPRADYCCLRHANPAFAFGALYISFELRPSKFFSPLFKINNGRGGGIRTPKNGFGDRRFTVEPTPLGLSPDSCLAV
jgi:hypothetical protein